MHKYFNSYEAVGVVVFHQLTNLHSIILLPEKDVGITRTVSNPVVSEKDFIPAPEDSGKEKVPEEIASFVTCVVRFLLCLSRLF